VAETAADKAKRLLVEGRLIVRTVGDPERQSLIVAECRGDSGEVYHLGFDPAQTEWRCSCPAHGRCSHLIALQLVAVRDTVTPTF
jgi:uncharacterized Zn finger protein